MTMKSTSVATVAMAACLLAGGANATTITLDGYNGSIKDITCNPSCEAFVGPNPGTIALSSTDGAAYPMNGNSSEPLELALLNELLVQFDPARSTVSYVNKTDTEANTYTTDRQYFSIKKQNNLWFFENTSGVEVTVTALGEEWSHTTEYGPIDQVEPPSEVPVPAAAWLFGSALLGLGVVKRRKA